jgi:hypothetical protein
LVGSQEGFLHGILCVHFVSRDPKGQTEDITTVLLDQRLKGRSVSGTGLIDCRFFFAALHSILWTSGNG